MTKAHAVKRNKRKAAPAPALAPAVDIGATDGLAIVRLDPALLDMIRGYVEVVRAEYPDLDVPTWDAPWWNLLKTNHAFGPLCHAIGALTGMAALLNVTPLEMIWSLQ